MAELEFAIVEFMISSLRGVHPKGYTPHERWIFIKTRELREKHFASG